MSLAWFIRAPELWPQKRPVSQFRDLYKRGVFAELPLTAYFTVSFGFAEAFLKLPQNDVSRN
jgi:hypothetical protein